MQKMLYDDVPYVVTYYYDNLEAYRSDRFTGFVGQPEGSGSLLMQWGYYSYVNIEPVGSSPAPTTDPTASPTGAPSPDAGGGSTASGGAPVLLIVGLIAAVVVIAVLITLLMRQRRSVTADDRE
jgi:peptide/nickel transport system substrate-binding protein